MQLDGLRITVSSAILTDLIEYSVCSDGLNELLMPSQHIHHILGGPTCDPFILFARQPLPSCIWCASASLRAFLPTTYLIISWTWILVPYPVLATLCPFRSSVFPRSRCKSSAICCLICEFVHPHLFDLYFPRRLRLSSTVSFSLPWLSCTCTPPGATTTLSLVWPASFRKSLDRGLRVRDWSFYKRLELFEWEFLLATSMQKKHKKW